MSYINYQRRSAAPAALTEWAENNPKAAAWIAAEAPRFEFEGAMQQSLRQWGRLTDRQLETVNRLADQSAQRKAAWAAQRAAEAPVCEVSAIEAAFSAAKVAGIKWPKLRLGHFVFSPAGATSANAGAVYVKGERDAYLGKVLGGRFQRSRDCSDEQALDIVEIAGDPKSAAIAHGKRFGKCSVCARDLSDPESVERGIGPVCADRYGWTK